MKIYVLRFEAIVLLSFGFVGAEFYFSDFSTGINLREKLIPLLNNTLLSISLGV
jgi:hypothetical protein